MRNPNHEEQPRISSDLGKSITSIACTLIAAMTGWVAFSAYQTAIAVAELKKDYGYLNEQVKELRAKVK